MTLAEFRRLTAHLRGDAELYCGGARVGAVWCDLDEIAYVTVDDDAAYAAVAEEEGHKILFREETRTGTLT